MAVITPIESGYQVGVNTGIAGAAGGNIFDPTALGGVGLGFRRISGGWDFIQPGTPVDAYGVSADSVAGWVYPVGSFGVVNIVPVSTSFSANTGQVITRLQVGTTQYLTIQHDYSFVVANPNVLRVVVTITNISGLSQNVKYRHICDVDVDPTSLGDQVVFPAAAFPTDVPALSFARWIQPEHPNPLIPFVNLVSPAGGTFPSPTTTDDLGWAFDFNFGTLASGESRARTFYYAINQPGQSEADLVAQLQGLGRTYIVRAHDRLGFMPSTNTACLALGQASCCPCFGPGVVIPCCPGVTIPGRLYLTVMTTECNDFPNLDGLIVPLDYGSLPSQPTSWYGRGFIPPTFYFDAILGCPGIGPVLCDSGLSLYMACATHPFPPPPGEASGLFDGLGTGFGITCACSPFRFTMGPIGSLVTFPPFLSCCFLSGIFVLVTP